MPIQSHIHQRVSVVLEQNFLARLVLWKTSNSYHGVISGRAHQPISLHTTRQSMYPNPICTLQPPFHFHQIPSTLQALGIIIDVKSLNSILQWHYLLRSLYRRKIRYCTWTIQCQFPLSFSQCTQALQALWIIHLLITSQVSYIVQQFICTTPHMA